MYKGTHKKQGYDLFLRVYYIYTRSLFSLNLLTVLSVKAIYSNTLNLVTLTEVWSLLRCFFHHSRISLSAISGSSNTQCR